MLGASVISGRSSSPSNNRVFVYEVTGLKQSGDNDSNSYAFRSSSSIFISVPYNRMNEEMQRISRMGGTIASIQPLDSFQKTSPAPVEAPAKKSKKNK
jgi:phycocyanin-associated, rod